MGRAAGFYWLRDEDGWTIGRFATEEPVSYHNGWWVCGSDVPYRDDDFIEIDETPITRLGAIARSMTCL